MAAKKKTRKIPTTKAGKPDKRYVKSVGAKSKATGKAPTKRTQKRRAKPQIKGYSANPVKKYVVQVKLAHGGKIGYLTTRGMLDDDRGMAARVSETTAEKRANDFFNRYKKLLLWVKVVPYEKKR